MASAQFSMRLPEELRNSLKQISEISHRSQSEIASKAIAEYIERNEWKIKAIQEGKKSAETGVFTSKEAIADWLNSWGTEEELPQPKADIHSNR